jgi:hypothetical protein
MAIAGEIFGLIAEKKKRQYLEARRRSKLFNNGSWLTD